MVCIRSNCQTGDWQCERANDWAEDQKLNQARQDREQRRQIRNLERELTRKEKALAETAALLVLSKKARAIWGEGEDE